jgi:cytoskeletal protein CcmA (bactofilin family)
MLDIFGVSTSKKDSTHSKEETLTFLARGFEFKGTLIFDGTVRIDGVVSGEIHTKGTIILGKHAVIEGNVSAGTIVSGGRINGNVIAREKVSLLSTAVLMGTITTPLLDVEEGVCLKGTCEAQGLRGEKSPKESLKRLPQRSKVMISQYGEL